jgi:hypothetical protein
MRRKGYQNHHIISDKHASTKNHTLLKLAGFDLHSRQNKIFLPNKARASTDVRRSIHQGRHKGVVNDNLAEKMSSAYNTGQAKKWTQKQYRTALDEIISDERKLLRSGERQLNKNARPGAYY